MLTTNTSAEKFVPAPIQVPAATRPRHFLWTYVLSLLTIHTLAALAFVPWFFSWTGVVLAIMGLYVFGTLGVNLGYHRLLAHQSFSCPKWLEHGLSILGLCCLQDTPSRWVAIHRVHHQHSDDDQDPHSPLVNFLWAHFGWLLIANRQLNTVTMYERYARDLLQQRFYFRLERHFLWVWVYVFHAALFYLAGFTTGWLFSGSMLAGVQFGLSLLIWGVFVRTVLVWHITWSVNSITHIWGYRTFETNENSRNNWVVGVLSNGEGWHNNHHAHPRSAAHGLRWWEFDVTYLTIRVLQVFGLAWNVVLPSSTKHIHKGPRRDMRKFAPSRDEPVSY